MEALILIDLQNDYFKNGKFPLKNSKKAAVQAARLLQKFRDEKKPVIHIQHISTREPIRFFENNSIGAEIHPLVSPLESEKVLIKHYPNSFRGTGLHDYLQSLGVTCLHIVGAMTNMCVDTTIRAGFDLGYENILYKDACAARGFIGTSLVHTISVKTLGSVFARVASVAETV